MNPLFEHMPISIFERMSAAAARYGAINLGQGFPDFGWPEPILDAAARALKEGSNQYPRSRGVPELREAIAAHYGRHHGLSLTVDNVLVTSGATEAIAASVIGRVVPGDEVIIISPAYDAYAPLIRQAGGIVREVRLQPPEWRIEEDALRAAVSDKTIALILNNPHNPTGRVFDDEELAAVAEIVRKNDRIMVIADEVWEHVLLDGQSFTPFNTLPGMFERTFKCGSAGKIFSLTGWKVGWVVAQPVAVNVASGAHQFLTFSTPPNLQAAVAYGLNEGDAWLQPMRAAFTRARDRMVSGLLEAGFSLFPSAGTYFQTIDLAASGITMDDDSFAKMAVKEAGVSVVPISPFYQEEGEPVTTMIRLCFAKQDATIDAGVAALAKAKELAQ